MFEYKKENKSENTSKIVHSSQQKSIDAVQRKVNQKQINSSINSFSENNNANSSEIVTGIPGNMKSNLEKMSSMNFDNVKVHYNSDKPAQLSALAYTRGSDVYVAPGQEKHLPHELGHVVQQARGEVAPTLKVNGVPVNDSTVLENKATEIGKAIQHTVYSDKSEDNENLVQLCSENYSPMQMIEDVAQLNKKIITTAINADQTAVIGINLMPSSGMIKSVLGDGRGYSALTDKIAGHSSIISGKLGGKVDNPMRLQHGKGFSPNGIGRKLLVGMFRSWVSVKGSYHDEEQPIVEDVVSEQLLAKVTPATQALWNIAMDAAGAALDEGVYCYKPETGTDFFGGGIDNCTTVALRVASNSCDTLIANPAIAPDDITNIIKLRGAITQLINSIETRNQKAGTTVGTQGRAMAAFEEFYQTLDDNDLEKEINDELFGPSEPILRERKEARYF
ncbi:MAG: DUF4157 domain-containing protein [Oscillospiraceae bacterium]|jgi:hypothetical protein|nr:DUF4157 domain-containing protein [Oscillospiraceae bacterium]